MEIDGYLGKYYAGLWPQPYKFNLGLLIKNNKYEIKKNYKSK